MESRWTVIGQPRPVCLASAVQAVARESRPLASVTIRRCLRSRIQATWSAIIRDRTQVAVERRLRPGRRRPRRSMSW